MKMNIGKSTKHLQIDKANTQIVGVIAGAAALSVFALIASKSMLAQMSYQNKVISKRESALKQLEANNKSAEALVEAFKSFDSAPQSVIGTNDKNSKIVLDALPSKYDFPALTTSLEKILTDGGYKIGSISGTDNELTAEQSSATPQPVEMPFSLSATGTFQSIQKLMSDLYRSIRPINVTKMELSGNSSELKVTIDAKSYYQPEKNLQITAEEVAK